ncbi:hypothetical protein TNCV_2375161 [Trichonephila clavipes]|nr:hypothetical protein TNCV_2375161 [Trichonephila clavipes]
MRNVNLHSDLATLGMNQGGMFRLPDFNSGKNWKGVKLNWTFKSFFMTWVKLAQEVVNLARQINLKVNSNDIQELLDSLNQELTIDELIEMQEQDIGELLSLDPVISG